MRYFYKILLNIALLIILIANVCSFAAFTQDKNSLAVTNQWVKLRENLVGIDVKHPIFT